MPPAVVVACLLHATSQVEPNEFTSARTLLANRSAAWNRGDLDGFLGRYWTSDRLRVLADGAVTTGWPAVTAGFKKQYAAGSREMGRLTYSDLEMQGLGANARGGADAVLVSGRWTLETKAGVSDGLFTVVVGQFPVRDNLIDLKVIHEHTSTTPTKKD